MTNEQWAVLEPLLPKGKKAGLPPTWTRRQLIDGIRFRVRTGILWRDMPAEYGPGAPGVRPVPPLAEGRHLAADPHRPPARGDSGSLIT
ncbi:transposase [Streptomyces sp. NPDC127079]|uniref:transposase n=1 Tax=Streptomyces sp. NPDC127079 TaxID=3347132 RepID=UPI00364FE723